ncbi:uncharacterized protein LOC135347495 [Halichondria panicea]|uniref:uncharacterized protein LOC135347495 n=1 Tax=Halichondria panicea TaxID=6063 RepID=UPI00312B3DA6
MSSTMDQKKPLLGTDGNGQPRAPPPNVPGGGAPSAPPGGGGECAPPPYSGPGGYGGVVTQQPYVPPYGAGGYVAVKPPNYMVLNAFAAFCCCLLCGLMGLYIGSQSDTAWNNGDRELSLRHSQNAKKWGIGGIIGGCVAHLFTIIILGVTFGVVGI